MEPRTVRTIGNACLGVGIIGLALSVVLAIVVASGAAQPPPTIAAALVLIQSTVDIAAGWNLRRRTPSASSHPSVGQ